MPILRNHGTTLYVYSTDNGTNGNASSKSQRNIAPAPFHCPTDQSSTGNRQIDCGVHRGTRHPVIKSTRSTPVHAIHAVGGFNRQHAILMHGWTFNQVLNISNNTREGGNCSQKNQITPTRNDQFKAKKATGTERPQIIQGNQRRTKSNTGAQFKQPDRLTSMVRNHALSPTTVLQHRRTVQKHHRRNISSNTTTSMNPTSP
jgi:hypothetical protein